MAENWIYQGVEITSYEQFPKGAIGFIYHIVASNPLGKREYIGRKQALSYRKKKFGKKKIAAMKDKRLKTYEIVIKENDWKTYTGSNKELNEFIKNGGKITKYITRFCTTKSQLTYYENKELYCQGVLENDHFYNENIGGKVYRKSLEDAK